MVDAARFAGSSSGVDWEHLTTAYRTHGVVLVLGAGVSRTSGLPDWPGLLHRTIEGLERDGLLHGDLVVDALPLPIIASILEERCGSRQEFVGRIRAALYREFPFYPAGVAKENRGAFIREIRERNTTLRSIASFCAVRGAGGRSFDPNPLVHAVVTFNLDALLEAYGYARYEKRLFRTIERASAQAVPGRINVYHMHGFLRFDEKAGDPAKESEDLVLTEQDYYDAFGSPTGLFNYTFLYLLRERPCVFVGLSMQDQNLRRLLHVSRAERVRGLIAEGRDHVRAQRESLRHFAILQRSPDSRSDEMFADSLRPLGTSVLWVDNHADLEPHIRDVYEGDGHDWSSVF